MVSHLQFADDILLVGEASWENPWAMKAIFRSFELVSSLKVNFHKSSIFGQNVENDFLVAAADFLNCRLGSLPFIYLGLPVGANPRRLETWKPVIENIQ